MTTQTIPTTTSTRNETADLKLEVVVLPVSDAERSKAFYESLGWRLDGDFVFSETSRRPAPSAGCCSPFPTSTRRTPISSRGAST